MIATTPDAPTSGSTGPSMLSVFQRADVNANFTSWLFDDRNATEPFINPLEESILAALNGILHSKQSGVDLVRRMPGVLPQLLQKLRTEDFSGTELARMIAHDVVLVAAVVRLANSACYGRGQPVTSLQHAILVLGHTGLQQLVTSVAFKPIFDLNSGYFTQAVAPRLWAQSEQCATANRLLAEGSSVEPFDAFLVGLVHNVGLIVSLRVIDQMSNDTDTIGSESFCHEVMRCTHALSCSIAREWRFPARVVQALEESASNQKFTTLSPIGKIQVIGDYLAKADLLIRQKRLHPDDPRLVKGLSAREIACLHALREVPDLGWELAAA